MSKKQNKIRADPAKNPVQIWLNSNDAKDILRPAGYTPLDKNEDIRRCVFKIADLVSSMTIMLMENGENGDRRLKNELSKKLDVYPNKNMTRKNFIHKLVTDMILHGNAVAYPMIKNGLIDNLDIWQNEKLRFDKSKDGYAIYYSGVAFDPWEVLHFVLNPDDDKPFMGQGYTGMIKQTVLNLLQANATKTGFLESKWKPSLIISINADVEELQDKEKRNEILGSYTRTTEIGEPWLIPAGEIDVKTIQPLTLNDLSLQDGITLDTAAMDVYARVERGDIGGCSFGFDPKGEEYEDRGGNFLWTVTEADTHEVSICTFPAYPQTEIQARQRDAEQAQSRLIGQRRAELKKKLEEMKC